MGESHSGVMFSLKWENLKFIDWPLALASFLLVGLGLLTLYTLQFNLGVAGEVTNRFWRQLAAVVIGSIGFVGLCLIDYRHLKPWSYIIYIVTLILLMLVLFFGRTLRGTTGWLIIGPFSLQPVEFMKLGLVIALARYFSLIQEKSINFSNLVANFLLVGIPFLLISLQPDFGSAMVLVFVWAVFWIFAGLKRRYILWLVLVILLLATIAWTFILHDEQKGRVLSLISKESDPLGRDYNIRQSIIAIGSGRLLGRGVGLGTQSQLQFLPEAATDFIFAVIAEELGFVGSVLVLGLYFLLFWRIYIILEQTKGEFDFFLVAGTGLIFLIHIAVNIGMNIGLLPITGLHLPFLSAGGSFMLVTLLSLGLIQSVAIRQKAFRF